MKKRILVVDDEMELCDLLAFQLRDEGYEVETAYSVHDALKKYQETDPKIILSDMQMPSGTGLDLLKEIKSIKPLSGLRFYIISGFVSREQELHEMGVAGVIKKPSSFADILRAIE